RAGQDHRVDEAVIGLLHVGLALLVDPLDRGAGARVRLLAERRERLLDVADLLLRLVGVVAELLLELVALGGLLEVAEHLEHGVLHLEGGAQLVAEELLGRIESFEHAASLSGSVRLPIWATRRVWGETAQRAAARSVVSRLGGIQGAGALAGSRTVNVLPAPGSLFTATLPPCASATAFTITRPSPVPLMPRSFTASAR